MTSKHRFNKFFPFFLLSLLFLIAAVYYLASNEKTKQNIVNISPVPTTERDKPQISGWVAWWEEDKAYKMIQDNPGAFYSVSPVWFTITKDFELGSVGKVNRQATVTMLKNNSIKVIPSLGSEISGEKLGPMLRNQQKADLIISGISNQLVAMGADGLDVDLEGIKKEDRATLTAFLNRLNKQLKKNGLILSVAVHAQTKDEKWDGAMGQDLSWIGRNADIVRIMIYDEHSGSTEPGTISSNNWIKEVIEYNLKFIDRDKMVIGIPSYGYIWTKDETRGLQFDEFNDFLKNKTYQEKRDKNSNELEFISKDFTGWLSDSAAMKSKISTAQSSGINKFVIWHLGGMDEKLFDKSESE